MPGMTTTTTTRAARVTRRAAAAGAVCAAAGALVPINPAAATPAVPDIRAVPTRAADDPGCTKGDGVAARQARMSEGTLELGVVTLWYSPSSRCVWGSTVSHIPEITQNVSSTVWRNDGRAVPGVRTRREKAETPAISDAGYLAAASGGVDFGGYLGLYQYGADTKCCWF